MRSLWFLFFSALLIPAIFLTAQEYALDYPAGIKWKHIKGQNFQVIYPAESEEAARFTYGLLEYTHPAVTQTMPVNLPRYTVILSGEDVISNGFVRLAPRHSRFYSTAPQSDLSGSNEWLTLLSVHEMRHMAQYERSRHGVSWLGSFLYGDYTQMGLAFYATPLWLWEGDAVMNESVWTQSGRGRIPSFNLALRGRILKESEPGYDEAWLQSLSNPWVDHYELGYFLTSYLKRHYGSELVADLYSTTGWYSFYPFAFERALKRKTGHSLEEIYQLAIEEYRTTIKERLDQYDLQATSLVSPQDKKDRTSYLYPQWIDKKNYIALRTKPGNLPRLVQIELPDMTSKKGIRERTISEPGSLFSTRYTKSDKLIAWIEYRQHPRRAEAGRSAIVFYSLEEEKRLITVDHTRITAIALSQDSTKLATIESEKNGTEKLTVYSVDTGKKEKNVLKREWSHSFAFGDHPQYPVFSSTSESVTAVVTSLKGSSIETFSKDTEPAILLPPSPHTIANLSAGKDLLAFQASFQGQDEIYALPLNTEQSPEPTLMRLTGRPLAAMRPSLSPDGKFILFNDYLSDRARVAKSEVNTFEELSLPNAPAAFPLLDPVAKAEGDPLFYQDYYALWQSGNLETPKPKSYHPVLHLIDFHSRALFYDPFSNALSAGIYSSDKMQNLFLDFNYTHSYAYNTDYASGSLSLLALYPVFTLYGGTGTRAVQSEEDEEKTELYREGTVSGEVSLPLNFTRGRYYLYAEPALAYVRSLVWNTPQNSDLESLEYGLASFETGWQKSSTRLDFYPRWGSSLSVEASVREELLHSSGSLIQYLPGLWRNHSFFARGSATKYETDNAISSSAAPARGYLFAENFSHLTGSFNYVLPLFYPNFDMGDILYFRRISLIGFHDASRSLTTNNIYQSTGADLVFDILPFSWPIVIYPALRYTYRHYDQQEEYAIVIYGASYAF